MKHIFPAPVPVVKVPPEQVAEAPAALAGWRPEHLPRHPVPDDVPDEVDIPPPPWRRPPDTEDEDAYAEPTTIFAPDTRQLLVDTAYPWSTCGRISSGGSGVMVGPRHLLTANHNIRWLSSSLAAGLTFTPCQFDNNTPPFGAAQVQLIYYFVQVDGSDGLDIIESAYDFVVCVLDRRLGMRTGWMGSRTYDPAWNGQGLWTHVGYPGDWGGWRPYWDQPCTIDATAPVALGGLGSYQMVHHADVWPGQSGGPYFSWWAGEPGPQLVGCQSGQNWGGTPGPNTASGGGPLPALINQARNDHP